MQRRGTSHFGIGAALTISVLLVNACAPAAAPPATTAPAAAPTSAPAAAPTTAPTTAAAAPTRAAAPTTASAPTTAAATPAAAPTRAVTPAAATPAAAATRAATPAAAASPTAAAVAPVPAIPTVAPAPGKQYKIAFSVPALSFPFFQIMEKDIKKEGQRLNVTINTLDGEDQTTKQTADIEAAIAQKVDGIVISPKDVDALVPAIEEANSAKIPVVTVDRTINKQELLLGHVGADNVEGGRLQARYVLDQFKNKQGPAKIILLRGEPGSSPERDRSAGILDVVNANKDKLQIVFDQTAHFRRAEAATVMENAITAVPQFDAVIAENDEMIEGASQVIKAKGLEGKVLMVGFDAIDETLQHIKEGTINATIEQWPGKQSAGALNLLYNDLAYGKQPAQKINFITPTLITKDNISETEEH